MRAAADVLAAEPATALHSGAVPPEAFQVALFLRDGGALGVSAGRRPLRPRAPTTGRRASSTSAARFRRDQGDDLRAGGDAGASPPAAARPARRGRAHARAHRHGVGRPTRCWPGSTRAARRRSSSRPAAGCSRPAWSCASTSCRASAAATSPPSTSAAPRPCCARSRPPRTPARPLVVRLRTTAVVPGTPLADDEAAGRFALPDDVEVARRAARAARAARRRAARAALRPRPQPAARPRRLAARRPRRASSACSTSSWRCRRPTRPRSPSRHASAARSDWAVCATRTFRRPGAPPRRRRSSRNRRQARGRQALSRAVPLERAGLLTANRPRRVTFFKFRRASVD